jgi:hypothetical protein
MLSSESLEIGGMFRRAIGDRYGVEHLDSRFRAFDTICSATQDRQDAILALLSSQTLDLMIVLGGYNSRTCNLAGSALSSSDLLRHRSRRLVSRPDPAQAGGRVSGSHHGGVGADPPCHWLTSALRLNNLVGTVIRRLETVNNR